MKCSLWIGVVGPLMSCGGAHAAYAGWNVELAVGQEASLVGRLYANFDAPTDQLLAVAGTPGTPMHIETRSEFYQHPLGTDLPPNPSLFGAFPSLADDTFVTIGRSSSLSDQTMLSPNWPGFGANTLTGTDLGWFVTPADPQSLPIDGRVLLGQFSMAGNTGDPNVIGSMLLETLEDGVPQQHAISFSLLIPAPGVLPLLVLGGSFARSRRRRS